VTAPPWESVVQLDFTHDCDGFVTGLQSVDAWFPEKAIAEQISGRMATFVCLTANGEVVAFFSVKHNVVKLDGASNTMRATADIDGMASGLLLAKMGVRRDLQGAGLGKLLVRHVMVHAAEQHRAAPFRLLVVDAENEALLPFYSSFGFRQLTNDLRLVMKMSAVNRIVAELEE
jgi:ribosomal protein S18 acetylase RimI-like enzyme